MLLRKSEKSRAISTIGWLCDKTRIFQIRTGGVSSSLLLSDSGLADILANTPSLVTGKVAGCWLLLLWFGRRLEEDVRELSGMASWSCRLLLSSP
jgi:hypothetical protein